MTICSLFAFVQKPFASYHGAHTCSHFVDTSVGVLESIRDNKVVILARFRYGTVVEQ